MNSLSDNKWRHQTHALIVLLCLWINAPNASAEESAPPEETTPSANNAQPATPPPPPRIPPKPLDLQRGLLIAEQMQTSQQERTDIKWFREGQKRAFLGLYTEQYSNEPQGYALILHDNKQHPDWPGVIRYLRTHMPEKGWSTLAISLPDAWQLTEVPPRDNDEVLLTQANQDATPSSEDTAPADANPMAAAAKDIPETDSAEATSASDDAEQPGETSTTPDPGRPEVSFTQLSVELAKDEVPAEVKSRIQEALAFLQGRDPMPIIVIATGTSATWVARQVHTLRMKDIAGLVIIDPAPVTQEGFLISEDAPGLRIPVLDLVPDFNPRSTPKERLRSAKQQGKQAYEQRAIPGSGPGFIGFEPNIEKAIRGWAKRVILDKSRFGYL